MRRRDSARTIRAWIPAVALWLTPLIVFAILLGVTLTVEAVSTSEPRVATQTVGERVRDLRTSIVASVELGSPVAATSGMAGVVTAVQATTGAVVTDGTHLASVNGVPVLAQLGGTPLFRTIAAGVSGPDVAELQSYLARVGVAAPAVTGTFDRATENGIRAFQKAIGVQVDGVFRPEYVAYLPAAAGQIESVEVVVGGVVAAGDPIATFTRPVRGIVFEASDESKTLREFAELPVQILAGEHAADLSSSTPGAGDLPGIAKLLAGGLADGTLSAEDSGNHRVVRGLLMALAEPVRVGAVPAEAVYSSDDGTLCIFTRGEKDAPEVTVLRSALTTSTEIGVAYVGDEFIGSTVYVLPSTLPDDVRRRCA